MYDLIESFFAEAKKMWTQRSQYARSRDFYQIWESVVNPVPFYVKSETVELFGKFFNLPESESDKVAFFRWDGMRKTPSLRIESTDWVATFYFDFDNNGDPIVREPNIEYPEDGNLSHGERLEVIYDVMAYLYKKRGYTIQKFRHLQRDEFLGALNDIRKYFEERTYTTMRKLPHAIIQKLFIEALEDSPRTMEDDERDFDVPEKKEDKKINLGMVSIEFERANKNTEESLFPIPSQTIWQMTQQLKCLAEARKRVMRYEKICKIPFENIKIMDTTEVRGEHAICFNVRPDLPLVEGDVITVFDATGAQEGNLQIDIYDGRRIFGRMRFDDRNGPNKIDEQLWALPVPSSAEYLADAMEHLALAVSQGGKTISPATRAVLGLDDIYQYATKVENPPPKLDIEQCQAWAQSCDERNKVVLVQGPPGTGKTSVLSAVLRTLVESGQRILFAAPSNAAVDNLIRRVVELPVLRIARQKDYVSLDIAQKFWEGELDNVRMFADRMKKNKGGGIFAGTQVSLMKSNIISDEISARGLFDIVVFDEAGMTRIEELILCTDMAKRAVLFGDHRQLLPFPLPAELMFELKKDWGGMPRMLSAMLERSALEWLCDGRGFPTLLLKNSYRCQNPRLIRFSSTLFYNAAVKTSSKAEYYRLPQREREKLYPPASLCLYNTSKLPAVWRGERIVYEGQKPGIENQLEAELSAKVVEDLAARYPLAQITVIVPYRRQVRLIRQCLNRRRDKSPLLSRVGKGEWDIFISMRISTVDSFQGGESDAVVINYVRSNVEGGVGFVDEPNRINVAHTRCRRELVVVGDFECLKSGGGGRIFQRMERAFARDGVVIDVTKDFLSKSGIYIRVPKDFNDKKGERATSKPVNRPTAGQGRVYKRTQTRQEDSLQNRRPRPSRQSKVKPANEPTQQANVAVVVPSETQA